MSDYLNNLSYFESNNSNVEAKDNKINLLISSSELKSGYHTILGNKTDYDIEELEKSIKYCEEYQKYIDEYKHTNNYFIEFDEMNAKQKMKFIILLFFIVKNEKDGLTISNAMFKKEYKKISTDIDKSNILQTEKLKNEAYFLKCEKDQLKNQLSQLNSIKENYDESLNKLKRKYGSKKKELTEALIQVDLLEKMNSEFKENMQKDIEQVIFFINSFKFLDK